MSILYSHILRPLGIVWGKRGPELRFLLQLRIGWQCHRRNFLVLAHSEWLEWIRSAVAGLRTCRRSSGTVRSSIPRRICTEQEYNSISFLFTVSLLLPSSWLTYSPTAWHCFLPVCRLLRNAMSWPLKAAAEDEDDYEANRQNCCVNW